MSIPLDVNGVVFAYPVTLDEDWGEEATAWAQAVTDGMLQLQGGSFPITADVNFGPNFGLLSKYFSTRSALPSTVGTIRLSNADLGIGWRNFANSGNLILTTDASDQLLYNGFPIATSGGGAVTSIIGTANQIIASSPSGAVTLSTPQDIAPASTPTFFALTLTATATQLVLGSGNQIGITAPTPAASRLYTIPDTGTVTSSFIMADGTQTINGNKTLTGTINFSALTASTPLKLDGSKNVISADIDLTTDVTGTLPVVNGGTGTTTSTGTGSVVLSNSPTLVTPALGTPSSVVLTNATGLPIDDGTTGTLPVSRGGTGATSFTAYGVLTGGITSTNPVQSVAAIGTAGQVLTSNGAGMLPTFQNTAGSGTVNSGTAGNLALYPATSTTVDDMYVQNSQNINIAIAAQAARSVPLTYTFPNPGNAVGSADLVLTESTQTINGSKTFSDPINQNDTTNQINLGTGTTVTINAPTPVASRVITIPDVGTDASFVLTQGAQTVAGNKTFSGTVDVTGLFLGKGTATNDSAASGYIGEIVSSAITTVTNAPTSGNFGDLTSISLTAGDWDVGLQGHWRVNANVTSVLIGLGTVAGNDSTGLIIGSNQAVSTKTFTAGGVEPLSITPYRVSLSATTTYYYKYNATYTGVTPDLRGIISARRVR